MIRWTTPTYELVIAGVDLTGFDVYVTFSQHDNTITVENPSFTVEDGNSTITCSLTQQQTAGFRAGMMDVQVNWADASHNRCATIVKQIPVDVQLLQELFRRKSDALQLDGC